MSQKEILEAIKDSNIPVSAQEIRKKLNIKVQRIHRKLFQLSKYGFIKSELIKNNHGVGIKCFSAK